MLYIPEVNKVLNPDIYQEFPLKQKTEISHNVAMYDSSQILKCYPLTAPQISIQSTQSD